MELINKFSVGVTVDEAWALLTDLERIAPCMPGFELQEVEGDEFRGVVKVKVGPMTAQYKGVATFAERDGAHHRAVVRAEGRDTRGQGNVSATITVTLARDGGGTNVALHTDLKITGKVAQFGRGVLADVSTKLLGEFVKALEADVRAGAAVAETGADAVEAAASHEPPARLPSPRGGAQDGPTIPAPAAGPRRIDSPSSEPVDLLAAAGSSLVKRVGPFVVVLVVGLGLVFWLLR